MKRVALALDPLVASEEHAEAFNALSHLTRLRVFFLLAGEAREMAAGEIAEAVGVPGPTLSRHLEILRLAGLVTSRREQRFVYYAVAPEMVADLIRLLRACC